MLRVLKSYEGAPLRARAHVLGRFVIVPLAELDAESRTLRGKVLSLGSGYGALERYVATVNPDVSIDGIELSEERVRVASGPNGSRVTLQQGDATRLSGDDLYDGALVVDLLHHLDWAQQEDVIRGLKRALRRGADCLVKDVSTAPAWKHRWNRFHDRLVTGPDPLYCRPRGAMEEAFAAHGFEVVSGRELGRWSPYAHYLLHLRA